MRIGTKEAGVTRLPVALPLLVGSVTLVAVIVTVWMPETDAGAV